MQNSANIDAKDGLETIDLTNEAETNGANAATPGADNVGSDADPPEAFFRKTKSNNFFAIDDSLDKIELIVD